MNAKKSTPAIIAAIEVSETPTATSFPMGKLTLTFSNGKTAEIDAGKLKPEILAQALMHGLKQKLVDAAALTRDTETGRAATIETKFEAVKAVLDRLIEGEWNKRREGVPTGGLLKRALLEIYAGRKTPEQIQSYLDARTDKEKAALRKNPDIATVIERLRLEDAGDDDTSVDLLAELESE